MSEHVTLNIDGRVAEVTLNRPGDENRVRVETLRQLSAQCAAADKSGADLLVLQGAGPHFCGGVDHEEDHDDLSQQEFLSVLFEANRGVTEFDGLVIAAVRGKAVGFGAGIAIQSDLTIASDEARLGFDEIRHGFAPAIVMTWLENYVPRKVAMDLLVTGRTVPAYESKELGLVSRVVEGDLFDATISEVVETLMDRNPDALRTCKFYLREIQQVDPTDRQEYAIETLVQQ